jgi:tetratricopeptide (TPR) repeat protein
LSAYYANNKDEEAQRLLRATLSRKPVDTNLVETALQISAAFHQFTNALAVVEKQLELDPDAPGALLNKGFIQMELGRFDQAVAPLTQVLSLEPTNFSALLYRGYAYLQTDHLDEAKRDYEAARNVNPKAYAGYYGLAEVARLKKDTNSAIVNYQLALSNAAPNSQEARALADRLKSVKPASP